MRDAQAKQAHDVELTLIRHADVASTLFRCHVPTGRIPFVISRWTFLTYKVEFVLILAVLESSVR